MSLVPFNTFKIVNSPTISLFSVGTRNCFRTFSSSQKSKKQTNKVEDAVFDQTHKISQNNTSKPLEDQSVLVEKIKGLLQNKIAPLLKSHGGGIEYSNFVHSTGILYVRLTNACSGCPMQRMTLKNGVQQILMRLEPKIKSVELDD
ncbi:nfu1 iron-sulfur cluster scaffold [Anaeramoeba flamelloides]|uniref:Nfu1 iron-sulfur cluster scaffold n=1 Tax=Anaeramoeba flamelloides TaxID=1746091 RepID=A0AAV7Z1C6_9EUKA|nr:nfu1 iron-sulfur cluster scaffold [Anaeramoeba flamelloides]KAJ6227231.1 nfu1 iron-sulfur cluster scaffold [Anaeramoeba flamelloides]